MNADATYLPTMVQHSYRSNIQLPKGRQAILISIQRITSSLPAENTEHRTPCSVKYMSLVLAFDFIGTT